MFTTKTTRLGSGWGCRIYLNGGLVCESTCKTRGMIGPTYRSMFRDIDKMGGDRFTSAVRRRMFRYDGPVFTEAKVIWHDLDAVLLV